MEFKCFGCCPAACSSPVGGFPASLLGSRIDIGPGNANAFFCFFFAVFHRGVAGPGSFAPTPPPHPPPPPTTLEIGTKVPNHWRQRRRQHIFPDVAKGKKLCFHPVCLYSIYSELSAEINNGQKWVFFQSARNKYPTSEQGVSEMAAMVGHCTDKQRAVGSIPSINQWVFISYWQQRGLEGVFSIFSP